MDLAMRAFLKNSDLHLACQFKQVFGNMFMCLTSGQAHVCDQNCTQKIFYDNHQEICRLSRRTFPRTEPMTDMARKRSGDEETVQLMVKRSHSEDWRYQQALQEQQQQQQQQPPQQQQQQFLGAVAQWGQPQLQPAAPQG